MHYGRYVVYELIWGWVVCLSSVSLLINVADLAGFPKDMRYQYIIIFQIYYILLKGPDLVQLNLSTNSLKPNFSLDQIPPFFMTLKERKKTDKLSFL